MCSGMRSRRRSVRQAREDLLARLQHSVSYRSPIRGALIRDPIGKRLRQHLRGDVVLIACGRLQLRQRTLRFGNVHRNSASQAVIDRRHINITQLQIV